MSFAFLSAYLRTRTHDERGATLVEYVFLISFIAITCLAAVTFVGMVAQGRLDYITTELGW
jgi:Flp pilus assembly pilin Flp